MDWSKLPRLGVPHFDAVSADRCVGGEAFLRGADNDVVRLVVQPTVAARPVFLVRAALTRAILRQRPSLKANRVDLGLRELAVVIVGVGDMPPFDGLTYRRYFPNDVAEGFRVKAGPCGRRSFRLNGTRLRVSHAVASELHTGLVGVKVFRPLRVEDLLIGERLTPAHDVNRTFTEHTRVEPTITRLLGGEDFDVFYDLLRGVLRLGCDLLNRSRISHCGFGLHFRSQKLLRDFLVPGCQLFVYGSSGFTLRTLHCVNDKRPHSSVEVPSPPGRVNSGLDTLKHRRIHRDASILNYLSCLQNGGRLAVFGDVARFDFSQEHIA